MTAQVVSFYVIAVIILAGGLLSVTSRKIFRSAIWLLFSLTGIAALYFWMDLQFLAAVQIVVYVGGIVVLIIFSIFLTERSGADLPSSMHRRKLISFLLAVFGFVLLTLTLIQTEFKVTDKVLNADVSRIGHQLLNTGNDGFVLPFEAISILLLAAMIGCIVIAIKKNPLKS